jgi:toxin ParE1/3/4
LNEIVWTESALDDLEAIKTYIEQLSAQAARAVAGALIAAGNSLINFAQRGRPVPRTEMRELIAAYPYIIRYQVFGSEVVILRVRHSARRPTNP